MGTPAKGGRPCVATWRRVDLTPEEAVAAAVTATVAAVAAMTAATAAEEALPPLRRELSRDMLPASGS